MIILKSGIVVSLVGILTRQTILLVAVLVILPATTRAGAQVVAATRPGGHWVVSDTAGEIGITQRVPGRPANKFAADKAPSRPAATQPLAAPNGSGEFASSILSGAISTGGHAARQAAALAPFTETLPMSVVKLQMVAVPAGAIALAGKKVPVKPFWIANTETTWEAFDVFTSSGPPSVAYDQTKFAPDAIARPSKSYILPDLGWGHHGYPTINVSFLNATMFCRWLSSATGKKYRLPTDAEWEYACRAGTAAPGRLTKAQASQRAWYADNAEAKTQPVGKKLPNAWKLYDMLGNVGEWATDVDNKPVLCGPNFKDKLSDMTPSLRKRQTPAWQATDPQLPKSRWWLSDGFFVGFRVVCEP